jgi:hypothetical protein
MRTQSPKIRIVSKIFFGVAALARAQARRSDPIYGKFENLARSYLAMSARKRVEKCRHAD